MSGILPAYCFTVPSLFDGLPLDCRIYHPDSLQHDNQHSQSAQRHVKKGAIVAHPYAPLGGCMDDPVVMILVEQLLELDFIVGLFNFRGAGSSQGSTSWSGKAERDDYISVAGHLVSYLHQIEQPDFEHQSPENPSSPAASAREISPECITLILSGYSYGSLILTHLPPTSDILASVHQVHPFASEIQLRAKELAQQTNKFFSDQTGIRARSSNSSKMQQHRKSNSQHSIVYGGSESPSPAGRHSTDLVRKSMEMPARLKNAIHRGNRPSTNSPLESPTKDNPQGLVFTPQSLPHVSTHYLLISPLLPPISSFLSFSTSNLTFWRSSSDRVENLVRNPTLVVFGTQDVFTSSHKLDVWCKKMDELSKQHAVQNAPSSFSWKIIEGAGHFWRERGVEAQLTDTLREWVQDIVKHS